MADDRGPRGFCSNGIWFALEVAYDFEIGGERYGGHDTVTADIGMMKGLTQNAAFVVQYDPLNPGRSSRLQVSRPKASKA